MQHGFEELPDSRQWGRARYGGSMQRRALLYRWVIRRLLGTEPKCGPPKPVAARFGTRTDVHPRSFVAFAVPTVVCYLPSPF
jgi:hypothetical protein